MIKIAAILNEFKFRKDVEISLEGNHKSSATQKV
jgi:hypothetical protein